jgi:hypothetical protein
LGSRRPRATCTTPTQHRENGSLRSHWLRTSPI